MQKYKVEISPRTIISIFGSVLFLYILWLIKDLLFSLFIAFILMSALRPIVALLKKRSFPHGVAVSLVYLAFILIIIILFGIVVPPLTIETVNLIRNLPYLISTLNPEAQNLVQEYSLTQYIPTLTNNILSLASIVFSNIIFVISTLFFGFYFLLEEDLLEHLVTRLFSDREKKVVKAIITKTEKRVSGWFWGELTLMTVIGILTFISLHAIGMGKYAISLAVLAGLLEAVPNIGPIVSAVPALIIGASNSFILGISVVVLYFIIQQLENNIIVPYVMKKSVGINPILTLVVLLVGGRLGGFLGILLAVPLYLCLETTITEILRDRKLSEILR